MNIFRLEIGSGFNHFSREVLTQCSNRVRINVSFLIELDNSIHEFQNKQEEIVLWVASRKLLELCQGMLKMKNIHEFRRKLVK